MFEVFTKIADWFTYSLFGLVKGEKLSHAVHFFIEDTLKIFFLLTILMFLMGFLRSWISSDKLRVWLDGKPKILAYLLAVALGAVTPFCSCSSIPLFIAFLSSGIPLGVTMAFLITSPMVNEVAVILFGEVIGWNFTFAYVAAGMITGFCGGVLIDFLKLERWVEPFAFDEVAGGGGSSSCCSRTRISDRLGAAWQEASSTVKSVWLYVVAGIGIGAAIHGFVPQEWFIENAGVDNLFAVPLAVLAAIPLYSNVTGTIPVAEVLINKGVPVGTTLAFIMSVVAISLPEIMILRKVLKPKMLILFTFYLAISFIIVGYIFNILFI